MQENHNKISEKMEIKLTCASIKKNAKIRPFKQK